MFSDCNFQKHGLSEQTFHGISSEISDQTIFSPCYRKFDRIKSKNFWQNRFTCHLFRNLIGVFSELIDDFIFSTIHHLSCLFFILLSIKSWSHTIGGDTFIWNTSLVASLFHYRMHYTICCMDMCLVHGFNMSKKQCIKFEVMHQPMFVGTQNYKEWKKTI